MAGGGDSGGYKWNGKHLSLKDKQRHHMVDLQHQRM